MCLRTRLVTCHDLYVDIVRFVVSQHDLMDACEALDQTNHDRSIWFTLNLVTRKFA